MLVTGRMHRTATPFALELGLEGMPLVSFNGAMARPVGGDAMWWHTPVPSELAVAVIVFLRENGLEPLVLAGDQVFAGSRDIRIEQYCRVAGIEPAYVGNLLDFVRGAEAGRRDGPPGDRRARRVRPVRPTKLLQVEAVEAMGHLRAEAVSRFGADLNVTTSYPFFLEFMNRRVSKGRALARVCRRLGVAASEVAAFGDGLNDLDMLKWAGLGVAMADGPAELREAADAVADGPPGEGVAGFIEENLLRRGSGS